MPKQLNKSAFPQMKRVRQKTSAHCGVATLEMLSSYCNLKINQDRFVSDEALRKKMSIYGLTVGQMAEVFKKTVPEGYNFWFKHNANLSDLDTVINQYNYPVGVEWQGLFEFDDEPDDPEYGEDDDDPGHYSVITALDIRRNKVMIADPDRHYAGKDRRFSVLNFEGRWWDENQDVKDYHMMYVVTPSSVTFPESLGMIKA